MIEFQSVSKKYRDGTAAVVDLDLTIPSDKITVIVGPSGCGKTTTLRMINRMLEPTSGKILWDDTPLRSKRRTALRRQMGYVIQSGGLFPHRTVLENITTVPGLLGWEKVKARKRAIGLLDQVGLDRKLAHRYPSQLSGGQQQRVGVARALCADPMVMLMDEPFSAVDPVVRAELHELFLGLQQELSKTIVLITHDIDEAIKLGDQVAILRVGGKLAQVGTPQQLLDEPADEFVEGFVGKDRGYRALSFLPADGLELSRVKAVRDPASISGSEPTLVIDADASPVGWADTERPGQVLGLGAIFDPAKDTMRSALDSALTSPVGLAVAVDGDTGRYVGTVNAEEILTQVTDTRASIAQDVSVRAEEARQAETEADDGDGSRPAADEATGTIDEQPDRPGETDEDTAVRDGDAEGLPAAGTVVADGAAAPEGESAAPTTSAPAINHPGSGDPGTGDPVTGDTAITDAERFESDEAQAERLEDGRPSAEDAEPADDPAAADGDVTVVGGVPVETAAPITDPEADLAPDAQNDGGDLTAPDAEPDTQPAPTVSPDTDEARPDEGGGPIALSDDSDATAVRQAVDDGGVPVESDPDTTAVRPAVEDVAPDDREER